MTKGCFPPFKVKVRDLLKEIPDILLTPLSSLQVLATILINFSNYYLGESYNFIPSKQLPLL